MKLRIALCAAFMGVLLFPAGASANHHLIKISEVYPGSKAATNIQWVELQMYETGQNFVEDTTLLVYDAFGGVNKSLLVPGDVLNGENQRSILFGSAATPTKDFLLDAPMMDPFGGAVCFYPKVAGPPIDCVAWGSFNPVTPRGEGPPTGPPALPGGIPDGQSLTRSIAPACSTLLEAFDDTDSSLADFFGASPTPRTNAVVPTETPCVSKLIAKKKQRNRSGYPKAKVKSDQGATVKLSAKGTAYRYYRGKRRKSAIKYKAKTLELLAKASKTAKLKTKNPKFKKKARRALKSKKGGRRGYIKVKVKAKFTYATGATETLSKRVKIKR